MVEASLRCDLKYSALVILAIVLSIACSRQDQTQESAAPPAELSTAEFAEIEQIEAALGKTDPALSNDLLSLRGISERWIQCGLRPVNPGPILEGLLTRHNAGASVRTQVKRLNELSMRNHQRSMQIWKAAGVSNRVASWECYHWQMESSRDWLAANPPNDWTHARWRLLTPPADTVITEAQGSRWRELMDELFDINMTFALSVMGAAEMGHVLQLCQEPDDGSAELKALLDMLSVSSSRRSFKAWYEIEKLSPAQRDAAEQFFELKKLDDRHTRRVWEEMGLTQVMRSRFCGEDGVKNARARLDQIAGR